MIIEHATKVVYTRYHARIRLIDSDNVNDLRKPFLLTVPVRSRDRVRGHWECDYQCFEVKIRSI